VSFSITDAGLLEQKLNMVNCKMTWRQVALRLRCLYVKLLVSAALISESSLKCIWGVELLLWLKWLKYTVDCSMFQSVVKLRSHRMQRLNYQHLEQGRCGF
jgi:ribosomal protein S26